MNFHVRGKFILGPGKDVDFTDHTSATNNFLHSLFSHCNVTLNGVNIKQESEHYNYRPYLEIFFTYGIDAAVTRISNAYWYHDTRDM